MPLDAPDEANEVVSKTASDKAANESPSSAERPVPITAFERRFKHPVGLVILFFAEMWERFSYYGMRGLLKLYMANYLFVHAREVVQGCTQANPPCNLVPGEPHLVIGLRVIQSMPSWLLGTTPSEQASSLYGLYTGLVYLTPVFGGILADRYLGQRRSVYIGGAVMAIGHFVMAIESSFFLALVLLILGNGFFKPNISTQVGNLYKDGDPRRDGAFTIFYMGINLGAFLCNLVCGTLAALYGWHYGFAAAGIGMCVGLVVYALGQRHLAPDALMKRKMAKATPPPVETVDVEAGYREPGEKAVATKAKSGGLSSGEWKAVAALVALCLLNVVFWAVYEQQGNSMQTWADEKTRWPTIFGFTIPSTWFQSFNPFIIFIFGIPLDMFWAWQAKRDRRSRRASRRWRIGCFLLGSVVHRHGRGRASHRRRQRQPLLAALLHVHAHNRRALSLADRAVARHEGLTEAHRVDDDGRLARLELPREHRVRPDRKALRRLERSELLRLADGARDRNGPPRCGRSTHR